MALSGLFTPVRTLPWAHEARAKRSPRSDDLLEKPTTGGVCASLKQISRDPNKKGFHSFGTAGDASSKPTFAVGEPVVWPSSLAVL